MLRRLPRPLALASTLLWMAACGSPAAEAPAPTAPAAAAEEVAPVAVAEAAPEDEAMSEHCEKMAHSSPYERTEATYDVPPIELTDQTGNAVLVSEIAESERPVVLNFIFATCTTICPVMTSTFAQMREQLGDDAENVRMVSITIDPEHDTPEVLAAYAQKYEAPDDWQFLTGEGKEVEKVLRSFDTWFGTKFGHEPVTLLHKPGAEQWIRLEGLGGGSALAAEVRELLKAPVIQ